MVDKFVWNEFEHHVADGPEGVELMDEWNSGADSKRNNYVCVIYAYVIIT